MQFSNPITQTIFSSLFTYEGDDLGIKYTSECTKFRVWAPTAYHTYVRIYKDGFIERQQLPDETISMTKAENGTWTAEYKGDAKGLFYTFVVNIAGEEREAVDPYVKSVGVNGERGQIIDMNTTNPSGWTKDVRPFKGKSTDAIVYEIHVRDASISESSGVKNKGLFLGLTEKNTTCPTGEYTGLSHIKELGVTHVQFLPIYDYHTVDEAHQHSHQYNWGYDPKNYNVPEGSYATDAFDGKKRILELKEMIKSMHDNGIGCIMDVVYNHTYKTQDSHLNLLVPEYYYRQNEYGHFTNGSGCGNEIASERSMVRKMIVDSVVFWATEYHMDGFRFDLMGLIDIETMHEIRRKLDEIDVNIITYGEGWTGGDSALPDTMKSTKHNIKKIHNRIGVFSDDFRDCTKGSVFNIHEAGFVNGLSVNKDGYMRECIVASINHPEIYGNGWANQPSQVVSYLSAHDNLTFWDKLKAVNPNDNDDCLMQKNRLGAALLFTSQGITFLQAGEEMARTKYGNGNSYNSPDGINQIDWTCKKKYNSLFEYYRGLIAFRKAHPALHLETTEQIQQNIKFISTYGGIIAYVISGKCVGDKDIAVIINGLNSLHEVTLPDNKWTVYVDSLHAGIEPLTKILNGKVSVPANSAFVLVKD